MAPTRRFRAPAGNGEVLAVPDFAALPGLVERNRRLLDRDDVRVGGLTLRELRSLARREALEAAREYAPSPGTAVPGLSPDAPLLVAGHQPELSHPGVWVKHFALNGLARKLGGTPLNLVVDNDTLKSTAIRFPVFRESHPESVHTEAVAFDARSPAIPYELRPIIDPGLFRTFAERASPLWRNWGYEPLLARCWSVASGGRQPPEGTPGRSSRVPSGGLRPPRERGSNVGDVFAQLRTKCERAWGCDNLELPVSRLSGTRAFREFTAHILGDLTRFREVYNDAVRAYRVANGIRSPLHPVPELAEGEAPFWVRTADGRRERATATSDVDHLRPRALTLTLFARVCLGDFFIHGIGGGKYDEVTDAIIRDYFGVEPPAYQVLSATLHLPLPGFPSAAADVRRLERLVRDLTWNPQRHLPAEVAARPEVAELVREKAAVAAAEPPRAEHAARRGWFHDLSALTERLRPFVADQLAASEADLSRARAEVRANAILRRRDYPWVLYPEETLRPFLRRFLEV